MAAPCSRFDASQASASSFEQIFETPIAKNPEEYTEQRRKYRKIQTFIQSLGQTIPDMPEWKGEWFFTAFFYPGSFGKIAAEQAIQMREAKKESLLQDARRFREHCRENTDLDPSEVQRIKNLKKEIKYLNFENVDTSTFPHLQCKLLLFSVDLSQSISSLKDRRIAILGEISIRIQQASAVLESAIQGASGFVCFFERLQKMKNDVQAMTKLYSSININTTNVIDLATIRKNFLTELQNLANERDHIFEEATLLKRSLHK